MDREKLNKILHNPAVALQVGSAILLGYLVKLRYLLNPNITIGTGFRAYSWLRISGPGKVVIGNRVNIYSSFLRAPCILTHTRDARVTIGNDTSMSGTRISCVDSITIGNDALFGSSTIIDSTIVPTRDMCIDDQWRAEHVRAIRVGNHVWTGVNSFILRGADLGDESVLGGGAVIYEKVAPERSLLVGNPARKIGETRQL